MAPKQESIPEFTLVYHAGLPGRAELVRLYFEATGTPYSDTAREIGQEGLTPWLDPDNPDLGENPAPFAPPILIHEDRVLFQTGNINLYLSSILPALDLGKDVVGAGEPDAKKARRGIGKFGDIDTFYANSLSLVIMDLINEVHNVHHPISTALTYEDQKDAAVQAAEQFRSTRAPKFLTYFEKVLEKAGSGTLLPAGATFVDLGLFLAVDGLLFSYPNMMAKVAPEYPLIMAAYKMVKEAPRIKAYLESERHQPYSKIGIFRPYPELDDPEAMIDDDDAEVEDDEDDEAEFVPDDEKDNSKKKTIKSTPAKNGGKPASSGKKGKAAATNGKKGKK